MGQARLESVNPSLLGESINAHRSVFGCGVHHRCFNYFCHLSLRGERREEESPLSFSFSLLVSCVPHSLFLRNSQSSSVFGRQSRCRRRHRRQSMHGYPHLLPPICTVSTSGPCAIFARQAGGSIFSCPSMYTP